MGFMDELKKAIDENTFCYTENGAKMYAGTGNALLDLNYAVSSLRNASIGEVIEKFACALAEDEHLAIKWLFFAGDVRGGMGERRLFRICLGYLADVRPELVKKLLPLVAEYTRYDNLFVLLTGKLKDDVCALIAERLKEDERLMGEGKTISLLCKWLPSVQTYNEDNQLYIGIILEYLGMKKSEYRKMLARMREYIKVTERLISDGKWSEVDYSTVPSKANLVYAEAFMKHDKERRAKYLKAVEEGKAKINGGTLFPYELVHRYNQECTFLHFVKLKMGLSGFYKPIDTVEELWKALPDYVGANGSTLCVADGSGSMTDRVSKNSSLTALEVAQSLAIYFAERASGGFNNKYITFSHTPQFVNLGKAKNLMEKIVIANAHCEVDDTNIEAVFDLVLKVATSSKKAAASVPANILILSDMEFNSCATDASGNHMTDDLPLFDVIAKKYADAGVKMPRLIFWNICGRTLGIPLRTNEKGLALVSGFSPSIFKMVASGELDPYKCLLEVLNGERYKIVDNALIG